MKHSTKAAALVLAVAATLLLSGCNGSDPGKEGVSSLKGQQAGQDDKPSRDTLAEREAMAFKFAACLRKNGVPDFPDPGDAGNAFQPMSQGDMQALERAQKACDEFMPGGIQFAPSDDTKMQDELLAFTKCMRKNGVDMPDPEFVGNGASVTSADGIDPNSATFQKAQKACGKNLSGTVVGGSAGTGG